VETEAGEAQNGFPNFSKSKKHSIKREISNMLSKDSKTRVKFLDSIAGLGDPDKAKLELRYAELRRTMRLQSQKRTAESIEKAIDEQKATDRFNEVPIGFAKDFSFAPGQEAQIPADLAEKWEAAGICVSVEKKAA
jgi:hypothetical protein